MKNIILFMGILTVFGCSSQKKLDKEFGTLKTVEKVDLNRFLGKWYVIANIPTFIEVGAHNAVETYTWNEKEQRIDVDFRFRADRFDGDEKDYPQKAWVENKLTNAHWKIQLIWPLKFDYLILDLDSNYQWTVIGVPNRKYIWLMARTPTIDQKIIDQTKEKMKKIWGYNPDLLQTVPQKW